MVKFRTLKKNIAVWAALFALLLCGVYRFAPAAYAAQTSPVSGGDGTYSVPMTLDLKMGADHFTNPATVEKQNGEYYLTFGHSAQISDLRLELEDKEVGQTVETRDGWTYYTYTLSERHLKGKLSFSAYINAMSQRMHFDATPELSAASKTADTVRDMGERPAEFVPVILTDAAASYTMQVGTVFSVPTATASLGDEDCEITVTASYGGETLDLADGVLTLAEIGEYRLCYRATSARYQTSLGNDSFTEMTVVIHVVADDQGAVRVRDPGQVLPAHAGVVAGKLADGSGVYAKAADAMKKIADYFEVYTVEILDENGEEVALSDRVDFLFPADGYFDRSKAEVYRMDEGGTLTKLSTSGYGRYVVAESDRSGTFVVCVPGVAFHMPMWGYAAILGGGLVLLILVVVAIVLSCRRRKKRQR